MTELLLSTDGSVARIAFNRPKVLNALSPDVLENLIDACANIANDDAIKVVRLEGEGACFSAGADLPAFLARVNPESGADVADLGRRATKAVADLPQITIAAIRGHCVGGGVVLAGACDIRIATYDASFLIPELDAGIPLAWGGLGVLCRLVGESMAADWVLSCRRFDGEEAFRTGLVSRVVSPDALEGEVATLAARIAKRASIVLRATKRQLLDVRAGTFDGRRDADALLAALADPEAQKQGLDYLRSRLARS